MRTLDRKLLRNLLEMRGQVLAIVLIITCGVGAFVTVLTAQMLQNPYPPQFAIFAKGTESEKLIVTGLTDNGPITFTLTANDCENEQERSIIVTLQGHTTIASQACTL